MEVVKTMIHDQDLPMHLWVEVARTTMDVQNKLSHSALGFKPQRNVLRKEFRTNPSQDIWLFIVCTHLERKKNQVGPFRKEGNISWIL
jgi:hypothetical protein